MSPAGARRSAPRRQAASGGGGRWRGPPSIVRCCRLLGALDGKFVAVLEAHGLAVERSVAGRRVGGVFGVLVYVVVVLDMR